MCGRGPRAVGMVGGTPAGTGGDPADTLLAEQRGRPRESLMQRSDEAIRRAKADAAAGRLDQAIASLRRQAARDHGHAGVHEALADLLLRAGQGEQALFFAERAAQLAPASADAQSTLGYCLIQRRQPERALVALDRALAAAPTHPRALSNLCGALRGLGRLDEAIVAMRRMVAAHGESEFAYADANVLLQVGMAREAVAMLRGAVAKFPGAAWLRRDLCVALNYTDDADEREIYEAHRALGAGLPAPGRVEPIDPDPQRPLRIGFFSGDFREHSVAYFLRPLLDCAGRGVVPVCYHCAAKSDGVTERLRGWAEASGGEWIDAAVLGNAALIARARLDRLDVAVDLAGWTAGSRLFALASRVATIQINYLGYPNTTGLPAMDARLVDGLTDPPGSEALATERLVRLPECFLCYSPPAADVSAADSAAGSAGAKPERFTFGSFNSIRKITPTTVRLWAGAMRAVPESRMIIKSVGLNSATARGRLLELLNVEGIAPERLELLDRVESRAAHLDLYSTIDVALDTYPYHGTTTTCEALWMGVPVVTLAGEGHRSRVGVSLLTAAALPDLAAPTPGAFAATAAALAGDGPRRATLRSSLRATLTNSALCDASAFADRLAGAIRAMWRERCAANTGGP